MFLGIQMRVTLPTSRSTFRALSLSINLSSNVLEHKITKTKNIRSHLSNGSEKNKRKPQMHANIKYCIHNWTCFAFECSKTNNIRIPLKHVSKFLPCSVSILLFFFILVLCFTAFGLLFIHLARFASFSSLFFFRRLAPCILVCL